jgi:hypothetical protein
MACRQAGIAAALSGSRRGAIVAGCRLANGWTPARRRVTRITVRVCLPVDHAWLVNNAG